MIFHQFISVFPQSVLFFWTMSPSTTGGWFTSSLSWYDQVYPQISLSHILIMPPFYHLFFLVNVPNLVSFCRQVPTWSMTKPPRPPMSSCKRRPRPAVCGSWRITPLEKVQKDHTFVAVLVDCISTFVVFVSRSLRRINQDSSWLSPTWPSPIYSNFKWELEVS